MTGTTVVIKNAVPVFQMEEVVIGSQFKFAIQFERLVDEDVPDVFEPFDFTDMVFEADIKDRPAKEVDADAQLTVTDRADDGWIDIYMDGDVSGTLIERDYYASIKVWPTGFPEQGDTLAVLVLPMKYKATR